MKMPTVKVIGAGLAGCEAAYYLAEKGIKVELCDVKPKAFTPAHSNVNFGELVCSNSLKSDDASGTASGLLKAELRKLGSLAMQAAEVSRVPAGGALAVDREKFSSFVTEKIKSCTLIHVTEREQSDLPEEGIIATGPLTSDALSEAIAKRFGKGLHFYDASAPVVAADGIDGDKVFIGDRYGKGNGDHLNCPMDKDTYELFVKELLNAEKAPQKDFEKLQFAEAPEDFLKAVKSSKINQF